MALRNFIIATTLALGSCTNTVEPPPPDLVDDDCSDCTYNVRVESLYETETFDSCAFASPVRYDGPDGTAVIVMGGGRILSIDPTSGDENWHFDVPVGEDQAATLVATPAVVGNLLVVEYHTRTGNSGREAHYVIVVDLDTGAPADGFDRFEVDATFPANDGETVPFRSQNALARAHIKHGMLPESTLGRVYVTYGNTRDIQPWHGFAFELDLDAWESSGVDAAMTGSFLTTPEADCGQSGVSGSRDRICGGGLWAPSGSLIVERGDSYDVLLPSGNGQLDLGRSDFANTLMRVGPGLDFDPGCDEALCANFDPDEPSTDCVSSCRNLFVPRDDVGDAFPYPETGVCEGLTMYECWAKIDYIGGSTPAHLELASGTEVLALPTKDGSVYLIDAEHLGTLYDREQLVSVCGTPDDDCRWDWAGMIVTQPAVPTTTEQPTILVPTFMPDKTHPAGVVALAIDESSGTPTFERLWSVPDFDDPAAIARFREHTTRIELQQAEGIEIAWIGESKRSGESRLLGIDVADGRVLVDESVASSGMRFTKPLVVDDVLFLNHCISDSDGSVEAMRIEITETKTQEQ